MKRTITCLLVFLPLFSACSHHETATVEESIGQEAITMVMPTDGKAVHPDGGREQWFAFGALSGVHGTPANGVAQAYYFEGGKYAHTAQVNIEPAADGYFYEGWLVRDGGAPLSTGHLENHFGDARHMLVFESDTDLRDSLTVVITLEPDDGDPAPAEHVAEGVMKVTVR